MKKKLKGILMGTAGAGKTAASLSIGDRGDSVFFLSIENGDSSLDRGDDGFKGILKKANSVESFFDYITLAFGYRPMRPADSHLSKEHHDRVIEKLKKQTGKSSFKEVYPNVDTIYIDSLTELTRLLLEKAKVNKANWTDKGTQNLLAIYQELLDAMQEVQLLIRDQEEYDVIQTCLIRSKIEDIEVGRIKKKQEKWKMDLDGGKLQDIIPARSDFVFLISKDFLRADGSPVLTDSKKRPVPVIATQNMPEYQGLDIKSRMGDLKKFEPPHLGKLLDKMRNGEPRELVYFDIEEE